MATATVITSLICELRLGSEHPINPVLRLGNSIRFALRRRLQQPRIGRSGVFGEAVINQMLPLHSTPMVYPR